MENGAMKVGDLARRTGLTVRTLHHYDEIGLLRPSGRTPAGHRLYGSSEIERLQQIASLRALGLPLDEIRECLERPEYSLERVLEMHVTRLDEEIGRHSRLRDLVRQLRARLHTAEGASVEDLTRTIEVTMSFEKHYTPEQMQQLARRREEVGQARIEEVQREWQELFDAYGEAMERGLDPASPEVQALARRSASLIEEFTGGDPGIRNSLDTMYRQEKPEKVMAANGMSMRPGLWEYMGQASAALQRGA